MLKFAKTVFFSMACITLLMAGNAQAQSAKATAKVGDVHIMSTEMFNPVSDWSEILSNTLRTSKQKDVFIQIALECGLYTQTLVSSSGGELDTSSAEARVEVRVVLDPGTAAERIAEPSVVTFCRRTQELSAIFAGFEQCMDSNGDGTTTADECTLSDEQTNLILDTMNANAFNFVEADLDSGVHDVSVQARISLGSSAQNGTASAKAAIGNGSMTVEEIRLIRNEDINL